MIDYLAEARRQILERFGDQVSVLEETIVESDRFYCFTFQSNEFIRTKDFSSMIVGPGYSIIYKEDLRFFNFGSRHSLDTSLKMLDEKLAIEKRIRKHTPQFELGKRFDLQINVIKNRSVLVEKLIAQEVTYVIPEVIADSIYRIPKPYHVEDLEKRLMDLPAVFQCIQDCMLLVNELLGADCCDFEMHEHQEKSFAKYIDKAKEEDLQPIW